MKLDNISCLSKGSGDKAEIHQAQKEKKIIPSKSPLSEKSHKDNLKEDDHRRKRFEGKYASGILRDVTTKMNVEDVSLGEYIKTIDNIPSTSSVITLKPECRDHDRHLPSTSNIQMGEKVIYSGRYFVTESYTTFFAPVIKVEQGPVINNSI